MLAHDLANQLLAQPNVQVVIWVEDFCSYNSVKISGMQNGRIELHCDGEDSFE